MPLPADLTESALAEWLRDNATPGNRSLLKRDWEPVARAVRELVAERVAEAVRICRRRDATMGDDTAESIVAAVMEPK